ncbi:chemotaxis protein CheR [Rhodovulum sp. BSW8]|uniref:Chemotaxis protein methyltransferase n=1 Tax=Rhodovulum visakhapatnamense TaxID=364297 RepID=A0A4R8FH76_9RHOB|nr:MULTISPECIES: CheR family methyltransferase [Rhodovulum]RBO52598.1 chemotaxis protein CheR [Rhodovulum sp. BSW8]TDX25386.1 CheR-type MCP methyltransferase [Rhodovulum visakhapatnamense]
MTASSLALRPTGGADDGDRIDDSSFSRIATLVNRQTGIRLPPSKRLMVEARLRRRVRACGQPNLAAYCRFLFQEGGLDREALHLIDVVTTNKTDFFRESDHFRFLAGPGLDAMLGRAGGGRRTRLKLWSAASSIGAEAYTIAMVLAEAAARGPGFDFTVLGTDISTAVLAHAKMAIYPTAFAAPVPEGLRHRYFMEARDPVRQEVRVVPELRARVSFARLNLMDTRYAVDSDFDAIFLRNVLIYFERDVQIAVVGRLIRHIRPGGFLFLGHSESGIAAELPLRQLAPATFQVE